MTTVQYYDKRTKITGKHSSLLEHFSSRERAIDDGTIGREKPVRIAADLASGRINEAVRLHARANSSDPFAAGRIRAHLLRGIETAKDVVDDATAKIARGGGLT